MLVDPNGSPCDSTDLGKHVDELGVVEGDRMGTREDPTRDRVRVGALVEPGVLEVDGEGLLTLADGAGGGSVGLQEVVDRYCDRGRVEPA